MERKGFVLAYRSKHSKCPSDNIVIRCLACRIFMDTVHGTCSPLWCTEKSFDNTEHVPVITMKGCKHFSCKEDCHNCVMYHCFGVKRYI